MDVEKFNKQLKVKVALAKSYEKKNNISSAIKIWLEVTEMTLNFSKSRNIDASYKNMLINRTKGIFAHIKNLKAGQIVRTVSEEQMFIQEEESQENSNAEVIEDEKSVRNKVELKETNQKKSFIDESVSIREDSEFRNLPDGFKEIQPKNFKIITPHDKDYVKKHLNQEQDADLFEKQSQPSQERFDFKQNESKKSICFACGYDKNPKNAKICKSCGTKLD